MKRKKKRKWHTKNDVHNEYEKFSKQISSHKMFIKIYKRSSLSMLMCACPSLQIHQPQLNWLRSKSVVKGRITYSCVFFQKKQKKKKDRSFYTPLDVVNKRKKITIFRSLSKLTSLCSHTQSLHSSFNFRKKWFLLISGAPFGKWRWRLVTQPTNRIEKNEEKENEKVTNIKRGKENIENTDWIVWIREMPFSAFPLIGSLNSFDI